jgi:hypothetical protein
MMFGEPKLNFELTFDKTIDSVSDNQAIIDGKKMARSYSLFGMTGEKEKPSSIILKFK